jgi:hypothetical protein
MIQNPLQRYNENTEDYAKKMYFYRKFSFRKLEGAVTENSSEGAS